MEKALAIVAFSCTLSAVYQSRILPYNGSFLKFVITIAFGLFVAIVLYKIIMHAAAQMILLARAIAKVASAALVKMTLLAFAAARIASTVLFKIASLVPATARIARAALSNGVTASADIAKAISHTPQKISNKASVIKFLMKKNSRIQLKLETLNAELHEAVGEIKNMVDNWSPNIEMTQQKGISKAVIKPATQDLHDYEFIEKTVLEASRQLKIENEQLTLL